MAGKPSKWLKPVMIITGLLVVILLIRLSGLTEYIHINNLSKINAWIKGFGIFGPVVYIVLYILSCIFFLPGIPITLAGAIAFGPILGTLYVSIGSTLGAGAAFLMGRYAARSMVTGWISKNKQLKKIDEGVKTHGWRMLMITRLVPVFPFNIQNYIYGLTKIRFSTYLLVSWLCMLPGTIAYVFAGGSLISGKGDLKKTFIYLAIAGIFFVLVSFVPRLIKKRYQDVLSADREQNMYRGQAINPTVRDK
jgi:uncharacterized membrane protein YdjX (TVP38/TMEM64 family)